MSSNDKIKIPMKAFATECCSKSKVSRIKGFFFFYFFNKIAHYISEIILHFGQVITYLLP